jgi:PAS domain S-box-containing protein
MTKSQKSKLSDGVRPPRRKAARLHARQPPPWPARPGEEAAPRTQEEAGTRVDESRQQAEQKFRAIFDNTSDGILLFDLETQKFTMCNQSCLQMLGYTLEEFTHLSIADLHLPADLPFIHAQIEAFLTGGQPIRYDIRFRRKDGSILFADLSPSLVVLDGRRYILLALKDITEHRRMEEELQQYAGRLEELVAARTHDVQKSERKYRSLVEKINDWVWEIDAHGIYTYVSPRAQELLGYAPEEIVGKTPFDLMPPAEAQRVWDAFEPTWLGRKPLERLENTLVRKDGRLVTVETSGMPVFAEDGTFLGYTGIDRDVTERKRAEEGLREKEYLLSESQRIGHIGTWSGDPATGTGVWTPEMYRLFGVSADTFVPTVDAFLDLLHPEDRDAMREWMRAALAGEHPGGLEFRVPLPDGSIRVLIGRGEAIWADDHRTVRLVGTAQDVTERKQTEEALRQLSRRNEEALRVARMGHWEFDLATGLFTFNDQYYTLHGTTARATGDYQMTAEEFARRYVHPDDAHLVQETIQDAAVAEDPNYQFQTEARILRADGEARWVTVWFRIEKDAQGRTVRLYGVNQDITERKRAEESLRELNERLELQVAQRTEELRHTVDRLQQLTLELSQAEDRERKRIADLLHDDVQQTLAAAKFHLNLLSSEPRSEEESREIVEQVRHMLKDAIEKARHLSHELSPALYQVDLTAILEWLARHMQEKHGLIVRLEVHGPVDSPSEPLKAFLYKVVQELLFNVVKHAGVLEARIRVRQMGRCLYLSVVDRGQGFDPQRLETAPGFGLLGIRERIRLLGGRMKIKSAPGAGSTLLIALPYEPAARAQDTVPPECRDAPDTA